VGALSTVTEIDSKLNIYIAACELHHLYVITVLCVKTCHALVNNDAHAFVAIAAGSAVRICAIETGTATVVTIAAASTSSSSAGNEALMSRCVLNDVMCEHHVNRSCTGLCDI
jgi:hypothetical protein